MDKTLCCIFLLSFYSNSLFAQSIDGKQVEEILMNSIFEQLIKETKDLRPPKRFVKKKRVKQMSRGRKIIEEMKRRNREKLAKLRGINPHKVSSGKDIVKLQKKQNKEILSQINEKIKSLDDWQNLAQVEIEHLRKQVIANWKEKHALKIKAWEQEKRKFTKNTEKYKETTFILPIALSREELKEEKEALVKLSKEYVLVPRILDIPIRDQQFRPTCSSFAGVRLIESELYKRGKKWDLSEQYFYWASKGKCRYQKCAQKGSWVGHGLEFSKKSSSPDIPFEYDCKYMPISKPGNETQIPLGGNCKTGKVKVSAIEYFHSTNSVISHLEQGRAVVASMKLTPNYYGAKSLILYRGHKVGKRMDSHAAGHSMVIVGHVKLPEILDEGRVCFIVANSWGHGWGKGGHACISEKWIEKQKQENPFVAVLDIIY